MNIIYNAVKKQITDGNYKSEDLKNKLDIYLLCNRINTEQYEELIKIMQPNKED